MTLLCSMFFNEPHPSKIQSSFHGHSPTWSTFHIPATTVAPLMSSPTLTPWLTLPLASQHLSHSFSLSGQLPSQTCAGPSPGRLFSQVYFWPDPHFILVSDQMSPYQRGFPGSFHIKQHPYFPPWALSCLVACVILYHSIVTTLAVIYLSI